VNEQHSCPRQEFAQLLYLLQAVLCFAGLPSGRPFLALPRDRGRDPLWRRHPGGVLKRESEGAPSGTPAEAVADEVWRPSGRALKRQSSLRTNGVRSWA
jgi:hypothetical protein